jgi:O-acetylserine/cysteine efflux transporter
VALGRARVGRASWLGFGLALAGVGVVGAHGGGGSSIAGDALVFGSLLLSAAFLVAQPRMLAGRDPVAVTAVQLAAAAVGTVPAALVLDGMPAALPGVTPTLAMAGLAAGGTLLPFTLFAWAQARVAPEVAGAFLNLEPLVGVVVGALAFGDPVGAVQILGGVAILGGIALSTVAAGQSRATIASARRSAAPSAYWRNSDGSVSSSSTRTGSPSRPWIMSTRAYSRRSAPPGTAASVRAATDSSASDGSRAEMSSV